MTAQQDARSFVLTFHCDDRTGLVHAVTRFLLDVDCSITESRSFEDHLNTLFFGRFEFTASTGTRALADLEAAFAPIAEQYGMEWTIRSAEQRMKVVVMTSTAVHCLRDLLYRADTGELPVEIVAVVSNHPDHRGLCEWHGVDFHHLPVTKETKAEQEARVLEIVEETGAELVVLARYMQILSEHMAESLSGRCINIHHSFLPSFKGARPYHQAFERGVKMVGATAHYVNSDLDEGPIIAQRVIPVDHTFSPSDLQSYGREAEVKALTEAVGAHAEHRVILYAGRTVVLR